MTRRRGGASAAVVGSIILGSIVWAQATGAGASAPDTVTVTIDAANPGAPISPFIRGINGDWSAEVIADAGIELVSWGGNGATRYNYLVGHAWNTAADWEFINVNHTGTTGDAFREYVDVNEAGGAETRLAVPTLGWIARDADEACSFPRDGGGCQTKDEVGDCEGDGPIADPTITSIESTPEMVADWVSSLVADGIDVRFIAMDNEPELWGYTHYDLHPECTTFQEVLDKYLEYARAIRPVAPDAELMGPVMCCWYDFWGPEQEAPDGSGDDFLTWFLREVRLADEEFGQPTLDIVDVHYYPQDIAFNDSTDPETNARRLRSTRSLWDPEYVDESWIGQPVQFIPRMMETIERSYPGRRLAITEWNFGAEETMNGALAIADVLAIYGREGVYAANYWRSPDPLSPGYWAFSMHGNYDGEGSAFEGAVLGASNSDAEALGSYATLDDETGTVRVMLVNKHPDAELAVDLTLEGFDAATNAERYTYGPADLSSIVHDSVDVTGSITVPAESIVVLEVTPAG